MTLGFAPVEIRSLILGVEGFSKMHMLISCTIILWALDYVLLVLWA